MRHLYFIFAFLVASNNAAAKMPLPTPEDAHYGIYLNGTKVGWMRSQVTIAKQVVLSVHLEASVTGMGTVSKIELNEKRHYNIISGHLDKIYFEQKAATGSVEVAGLATSQGLALKITAGKQVTHSTVQVNDTLESAMAVVHLATAKNQKGQRSIERFDASLLKTVKINHRVVRKETKLFAGVQTKTVKIESTYPDLGITETAWVDQSGTIIESKVGGFFVARLEAEDEAKRIDYSQDILVSAVVHTPKPIHNANRLVSMQVEFTGFGNVPVEDSPRQRVTRNNDRVTLKLTKDRPKKEPLYSKNRHKNPKNPMTQATPFIQSNHDDIITAAKDAIGDTQDLFTATSRLSAFVFQHVRDEYVPAYSNALEALNTQRGDCTEHSVLFVALARSLGIPARVAVGIAYWPPGNGFGWHAWAEIQTRNGDWYSVDPTWNQPIADATHIKLANGGPAEQARIVMLLGRLRIVSVAP